MASLTELKRISDTELESRIEEVKALPEPEREHEHYRVVKDKETGEHFLHYAYVHVDVAGGGTEEWYHQLLPLDTDEVLGIILGEQPYAYPEHWRKPFLRNGPEGAYVWFDPGGADEASRYERLGRDIADVLAQYKRNGQFDERTIRRMMEQIERLDRE